MPGVPPDAANIVKKVFKGIFRRGKKGRQDDADSSSPPPPQQDQSSAPPAPSSAPQVDTKPPQLPPIGNASPLQGASESPSLIPPTHPLSTGEHSTPQEAVPQNKDADPAPGPPLGEGAAAAATAAPTTTTTTTTTTSANDNFKEPEKLGAVNAGNGDVSPPVSAADGVDPPKSGAVSAISNEQPKTDGVAESTATESGKVEEPASAEPPTSAAVPSTNTTASDTTEKSEPVPVAVKENAAPQTNGTSPTDLASSEPTNTTSAPTVESKPTETTSTETTSASPDEKMPTTMEEPPPIKTVRAAPGMSATSGPLEDFPEGGDQKD